MLSLKPVAVAAAAIGLLAALPAGAVAAPSHHAHAAGGAPVAPLLFPSIVNTRLVRAQSAIDRAAKFADRGDGAKAATELTAARLNLSNAWTGAKYVIKTAPPPAPATDAAFHRGAFLRSGRVRIAKHRRSRRVHQAGTAPVAGASPYASQYDTAFAVISLQHYAATVSVSLVPDTSGTTLTNVRSTLARAVNDRDAAIAYIHSIDPGPPPAADAKVHAHSAGTAPAAGSDWTTVMPNATPLLGDEAQQAEGEMEQPGVTAAQMSILKGADYRAIKTQNTLNQYWPPPPPAAG
jgi:hypothetical protein